MIILKELWILAKVGFIEKEEKPLLQTLIFIIKIFVFSVILNIIIIGTQILLTYTNVFHLPTPVGSNMMNNYSFLEKILFVSVVAPITEELAFRIGLKFSKLNISIMVCAIVYFMVKVPFLWLVITSVFSGILTYYLLCKTIIFNFIKKNWNEKRKVIFYTLLLLFSFYHLINFNITLKVLLLSPILLLPQFIGGFLISYVRLKSGIISAILLHSLNNFIILLIT